MLCYNVSSMSWLAVYELGGQKPTTFLNTLYNYYIYHEFINSRETDENVLSGERLNETQRLYLYISVQFGVLGITRNR